MMTLIAAAIAAAQPAPPADPHAAMAPMPGQHEAKKERCCCEDMAKGGHENHAPGAQPHDQRGE